MTAPARRATQIFDRGRQSAYAAPGALELRRELDPNEGARWAIVVAAMLLFAYSVVSGPVNFAVARNRGRPLSALVALPLLSLGAFLLIVLLESSSTSMTVPVSLARTTSVFALGVKKPR